MATLTQNSGALNLVAGLAATTKGKAKDAKPAINDPALAESIETYIARKAEAETATALKDAAAEQIISAVRPRRLEACAAAGKVLASVTVNNRLTYTQTCRYSTVAEERKEALADAFGDAFGRYFADTLAISLKRESANDEAVLSRLIDALGGDFFAEHFEVKRDLLVQEAFHNDYSIRPEVQAIAEPFIDEQTIRPYSPSLKIK